MKSGTNWLGGLLDRHPEISCKGEYHWELVLKPLLDRSPLMLAVNDEKRFRETVRQFRIAIRRCMLANADPKASVIGDRTPHTIVPIILKVPHIVIVRDGRDILVSRAFHLFNRPDVTKMFERFPDMAKSLKEFQKDKWHFKLHPEELLANRELVTSTAQWWKSQLDLDRKVAKANPNLAVKFVRYEDLLVNTQGITDNLFQFLGVDPAQAPPIEGILQPGFESENPDLFLRKGQSGDWKNYFTEESKAWFKKIAGAELVRQGYEVDSNW